MLVFAPLCLLLCLVLPAGSQKIRVISTVEDKSFPLDMAENSVDDMYSTCSEKMAEMVKNKFMISETKSGDFKDAWKRAEKCANRKIPPIDEQDNLTKDHRQAICVYTSNFYKKFNNEVRTRRQDYISSFPFHSLHFLLTRAIQILSNNKNCNTTYRRTNTMFTGRVNQVIRFGIFASSSLLPDLFDFGKVTCFKITTCSGAYLKKYPELKDKEQEVLIPPYEKFKITKKCEKNCKSEENLDCKIVYVLESVGVQSNLDCQIAKNKLL